MDEIRERTPPYEEPLKATSPAEAETISVSQFKATCLSVLERVRATGMPLLITKRGEPLAQVLPPPLPVMQETGAFGCMAGTSEQLGDILEPLSEEDWEVLR